MNGPFGDEQEQARRSLSTDHNLNQWITSSLQAKASQVQLTPELRLQIIQRTLGREKRRKQQRLIVPALALIAVLVFASIAIFAHIQPAQQLTGTAPGYSVNQLSTVAPELAAGGLLLSVDPTDQRIIYQPAHQAGVLYVAKIADPAHTSVRAMDNAQDMAWSKDGSALVATVTAKGSGVTALALVPVGHYMHLLGEDALAASWSPGSAHEIVYATQSAGKTQLWHTDITGQTPQLQTTLADPLAIQHMYWSPDGDYLAFVTGTASDTAQPTQAQKSRAIYVMDARTGSVKQLVAPSGISIGSVAWSPDSQYLTYEQLRTNQRIQLESVNIQQPGKHFSILPQHNVQGWSWAPDSHALVYSDNGILYMHAIAGQTQRISSASSDLISPFWLKDGHILCMQIQQTQGKLAILTPQT